LLQPWQRVRESRNAVPNPTAAQGPDTFPTRNRRKIRSMESPTLAGQAVSAEVSEFARIELAAFVATSKRQRPSAWSRVDQLRQACRRESPATAAGLERSKSVLGEATAA
jgi:hypothetical protein